MRYQSRRILSLLMVVSILSMLLMACGATNTTGPAAGSATTSAAGSATTSAAGGAATTSAAGGAATTSAAGSATTSAAGGAATTSAAGGAATTSAAGGATTPAAGATSGAGSSGGGSSQPLTLPANCSNVQLQYWNPFTGPDGPLMGNLVNKFNQANPNIKVTMTSQAEYTTQLGTAAASDTLPDVAVINEDQVATQTFRNILRPMDSFIGQLGYTASDFPAAAWNLGMVAGKRYAIPLSIVPMTMYYNADLLKSAGLSGPPKTADDFTKAAAAITKGNTKGFAITNGFPVQQIFQQLLHQYGGTEFSADGSQATWNSDAGVKALQWMKDAQSKYSEQKLEVDADLNAFKTGSVGMIWNGIWQTTNVTGNAVSFAGKATGVPQIGTQSAVWAGMATLALPTHKKGADACKDTASLMLIRYLIDNSLEWSKAGNIPAYNKVRNSPELKALDPQGSIAPTVDNPVFPPSIPGISDAFAPLSDAVGAVMGGNSNDIKGALDDAAKRANQILADNKKNYGDAPKQ